MNHRHFLDERWRSLRKTEPINPTNKPVSQVVHRATLIQLLQSFKAAKSIWLRPIIVVKLRKACAMLVMLREYPAIRHANARLQPLKLRLNANMKFLLLLRWHINSSPLDKHSIPVNRNHSNSSSGGWFFFVKICPSRQLPLIPWMYEAR